MIRNLTFKIIFKKQTQQLLGTSDTLLKGPERKKAKNKERNMQQLSCTSHERTINNSTKMEQKIQKYGTRPCPPTTP